MAMLKNQRVPHDGLKDMKMLKVPSGKPGKRLHNWWENHHAINR